MGINLEKIERRARRLAGDERSLYGFNGYEPVDVFKVLKIAGISCIKKPLKSDISGIFLKASNVKVILINSNKSIGHQNFTAAHELYHSEFDEGLEGRVCKVGKFDITNEPEIIADYFAAHFLMPEEGIRINLDKRLKDRDEIDIGDVIFLEQLYSVSHLAMLNRLLNLKIIDSAKKDEFLLCIRMRARVLGYDDSLYLPSNDSKIFSDYAEKAKLALDKDLITFSRYEELLADADLIDLNYSEEVEDYVD